MSNSSKVNRRPKKAFRSDEQNHSERKQVWHPHDGCPRQDVSQACRFDAVSTSQIDSASCFSELIKEPVTAVASGTQYVVQEKVHVAYVRFNCTPGVAQHFLSNMAFMRKLGSLAFNHRYCPPNLLSYRSHGSLPATRPNYTLSLFLKAVFSPKPSPTSLLPPAIVPYVHPTGRGVCPSCTRITSKHLGRFRRWGGTGDGIIDCVKCDAHLGVGNVDDLPSWTATVNFESILADPHDSASKFMQDANTLLSVGRAIGTLVARKSYLDLSPAFQDPDKDGIKYGASSSHQSRWYPYIEDMASTLRWQTEQLLRPRFLSLRANERFKMHMPSMQKTLKSLDSVIKSLQNLLPEQTNPPDDADGHEVRASPPEIALELVAQVVQAEARSYPTTPEELRVFRKFTEASIRESWLTLNPVEQMKTTVHDLGLEKRVLPLCSYVIFPSKSRQSERGLHWVTVRSTFMGWNHKGQQALLRERRDGLAKSFAHLPAMQRAKQDLINKFKDHDIPQGTESPYEKAPPSLSPGIAFNNNIKARLPCQICGYFHNFHISHEVGKTKRMDERLWKKERAIFSCAELGVAAIMHCVDEFDRRREGL